MFRLSRGKYSESNLGPRDYYVFLPGRRIIAFYAFRGKLLATTRVLLHPDAVSKPETLIVLLQIKGVWSREGFASINEY
jgi:hypothetical protein